MADAIRRHLETILDEGNPPADENDRPQWRGLVLEMPIPGYSHEDVGNGQQENGLHTPPLLGTTPSIYRLGSKLIFTLIGLACLPKDEVALQAINSF